MLNHDKVTGNNKDKNENIHKIWKLKEGLFCKEELEAILKRLKNKIVPGSESVVNEFLNMMVVKLEINS